MQPKIRPQAVDPARVRGARASQFTARAASLIEDVRVVFCEPLRTQIILALRVGPLTVTELVATTGRTRTVVSQHLRILRQESLVESVRRGRLIFYGLTTGLAASAAVNVLAVVAEVALRAPSGDALPVTN